MPMYAQLFEKEATVGADANAFDTNAEAAQPQSAAGPDRVQRQVGYTRLPFLGAHISGLPAPTVEELGIEWIHDVCHRLWMYRSADHFEPDITVPIAESQWRETRALSGSTAESLMLGTAALIEIAWLERGLQQGKVAPRMGLGQRYYADTVCETSIAVGHRLINLIARVLRTDAATQQRMATHGVGGKKVLKWLGPGYKPFNSTDRGAWLSLNEVTLNALRDVAPAGQGDVAAAVNRLADLEASPEWGDAFEHRAENFHRWRLEHEYVAGVDQVSGNARDVYDHTNQIVTGKRYGGYNDVRYSAADGLGDQAVVRARTGLVATAHAADDVLQHILDALPDLTKGCWIELGTSTITSGRGGRRRS
ncbi:hypothetical protein NONI108955_40420 [Nocardia ninae]